MFIFSVPGYAVLFQLGIGSPNFLLPWYTEEIFSTCGIKLWTCRSFQFGWIVLQFYYLHLSIILVPTSHKLSHCVNWFLGILFSIKNIINSCCSCGPFYLSSMSPRDGVLKFFFFFLNIWETLLISLQISRFLLFLLLIILFWVARILNVSLKLTTTLIFC